MHGDFGRTLPNLHTLLDCNTDIIQLDVLVSCVLVVKLVQHDKLYLGILYLFSFELIFNQRFSVNTG